MGPKEHCCIDPIPFDDLYSILHYFSPHILVFQELPITEAQNQCHWILHASLYMCHSSHFDAFFPVKINKM